MSVSWVVCTAPLKTGPRLTLNRFSSPESLTIITSDMEEDERSRLDQFKAWHDEAFLYINQAITQEKPNIDRKDVALMMYQKGLGLIDLALCVDTEVRLERLLEILFMLS